MDSGNPVEMMRSVSAVIVLDLDGRRVVAHYYDKRRFPDLASQRRLEKQLMRQKCLSQSGISLIDDLICLNSNFSDLKFFVVGQMDGNELLMHEFLVCIMDLFRVMFKESLCRSAVMENMHAVLILLDEVCESGIILETNPTMVIERLRARTVRNIEDMTLGELIELAKEKLMAP